MKFSKLTQSNQVVVHVVVIPLIVRAFEPALVPFALDADSLANEAVWERFPKIVNFVIEIKEKVPMNSQQSLQWLFQLLEVAFKLIGVLVRNDFFEIVVVLIEILGLLDVFEPVSHVVQWVLSWRAFRGLLRGRLPNFLSLRHAWSFGSENLLKLLLNNFKSASFEIVNKIIITRHRIPMCE